MSDSRPNRISYRAVAARFALLATLVAAPAVAAPVQVSGAKPTANVKVLKPLTLVVVRNLEFGTIIMGTLASNQIVTVNGSGRTCGTANLTCSGTFSTAQFRVNGSNQQAVSISSSTTTVTLSNGAGGTLSMTPSYPSSVTLDNSGNPGATFDVGGSLTITPSTSDGMYTGTLEITVAYQ